MQHRGFEHIVHRAVHHDVDHGVGELRGVGGQEDRVNDVNHAIAGHDVRHRDLGVVDENAFVVEGHHHVGTVQCRDELSIAQIGAERCAAHHVVKQDVGEFRQGQELFGGCTKRPSQRKECIVRGCKHGEGSVAAQGACKVRLQHRGFEHIVHWAVHHDVHHSGRDVIPKHGDGAPVSGGCGVVVVGAWDVKVDRADARPEEPKAVCRGQCKILRVVERLARVDVGDAVDIMGATKRNELHAFASVDG